MHQNERKKPTSRLSPYRFENVSFYSQICLTSIVSLVYVHFYPREITFHQMPVVWRDIEMFRGQNGVSASVFILAASCTERARFLGKEIRPHLHLMKYGSPRRSLKFTSLVLYSLVPATFATSHFP